MTVGMTIDPSTFMVSYGNILAIMALILVCKLAVVCVVGPLFGLSLIASVRAGLMIGPGGEFAFVTFGEAVRAGLLASDITNQINLAVVLTMAATPFLADLGSKIKDILPSDQGNVQKLKPAAGEVDDLSGHVIIAGYGRVGQIVAQLLNDQLIQVRRCRLTTSGRHWVERPLIVNVSIS